MSQDNTARIAAVHLPREMIPHVLPLIHPHLARFCKRFPADYDLGEALAGLLTGELVGFMAWEPEAQRTLAVAYGRLVRGGDGLPQLRMEMIEGKGLARWLEPMRAEIKKFAAAQGCKRVRATMRPGWVRALKSAKPTYYIMEEDV